MKKKRERCGKLSAYFRMIDMYGKNISLRIDGEESYKSLYGAFVSFIVFCGVIILFIVNIVSVLKPTSNDFIITQLENRKNLNLFPIEQEIGSLGIFFAT